MTATRSRIVGTIWLAGIVMALGSSAASAQSQVRVTRDDAVIWRRDAPGIVAATVKTGTVLDVVGMERGWYVVAIPPENGGQGEAGLIAAAQIEVLGGGVSSLALVQTRRAPPARRAVEVSGFGDFAYGSWLAHDTFNAVLGSSRSVLFGGGVQVRFRRLFIEGAVERFQKTGGRVFVHDGQVFELGIADTLRLIPITATVGYRHPGRHVAPYVAGGIGTYLYKETSEFADPSEILDESSTSFHVLAGLEIGGRRLVRLAFEMQLTTVPNALGDSGASAAFNEKNLGGVQARVKILVGH